MTLKPQAVADHLRELGWVKKDGYWRPNPDSPPCFLDEMIQRYPENVYKWFILPEERDA